MDEKIQKETFELEKFKPSLLPELQNKKKELAKIIKKNPVVEITDNASYEVMKKSRTNVRTTRTNLEKEKKSVSDRIKEIILVPVSAEYDGLIEYVTEAENLRQEKVTIYENKKKEEAAEKERLNNLRIAGAKELIDNFYNTWSKEIDEMTFESIEDLSLKFPQAIEDFDETKIFEFGPLLHNKVDLLTAKFLERRKLLEALEANRIEAERLANIEKENQRKKEIQDMIIVFGFTWARKITALTGETISDAEKEFKNIKDADYKEFQEEYLAKKVELHSQIIARREAIEQDKKQKQEAETLRLEKEKLDAEKLAFQTEKRIKQLTDLGFKLQGEIYEYKDESSQKTFTAYGMNSLEDEWNEYIQYVTTGIQELKNSRAPIEETHEISKDEYQAFEKLFNQEEVHDHIGGEPILTPNADMISEEDDAFVENYISNVPAASNDEEDLPAKDVDFETIERAGITFHFQKDNKFSETMRVHVNHGQSVEFNTESYKVHTFEKLGMEAAEYAKKYEGNEMYTHVMLAIEFGFKLSRKYQVSPLQDAVNELVEASLEAIRMYEEIEPAGGWKGVHDGLKNAVEKSKKLNK